MGHLYITVNLSNDDNYVKHRNQNMGIQKYCQHSKLTQNRETKQNVESIKIEKENRVMQHRGNLTEGKMKTGKIYQYKERLGKGAILQTQITQEGYENLHFKNRNIVECKTVYLIILLRFVFFLF